MLKKILSLSISLMLLISLLQAYEYIAYASEEEPQVHVKLKNYLGNKTQISIKPAGTYKIGDKETTLNSNKAYTLELEDLKLNLYLDGKLIYSSSSFTLSSSSSDSYLTINNREYKGSFQFMIEAVSGKNYIRPINTVGMEDYVKGVVPNEMYASWNIEALKAQAVAARTYSWNFDNKTIDDTTNYQVYGGYMIGDYYNNSNKAVADTTGQVLKYNNRLIDAVFSASNGGIVESAKSAWGNEYAYLQSYIDPYDTNYSWNFDIQTTQIDMKDKDLAEPDTWWNKVSEKDSTVSANIKKWLKDNGYEDKDLKIVSIPTLSLNNPSATKRVAAGSLTVQFYVKDLMNDGELALQTIKKTNVNYTQMRAMLGSSIVKTSVIIESSSSSVAHSIAGRGYGHGVGLSQYGSNNRAIAGQNYKTILEFYYPGTDLITEYTKTDISGPFVKDAAASFSSSNDTVNVSFTLTKTANIIVRIKDSANKIITTLLNNESIDVGSHSYTADVSDWSNGNYTAEIIAIDSNNNQTTMEAVAQVAKVSAPSISSIKTSYDVSTNKMAASFIVNQATKTTVNIKDSNNKVIKTLASSQSIAAGTASYSWDTSNVNNGTYTLEIVSANSAGKETTSAQKFILTKASIATSAIKDVKTSYDAKNNKVQVSFHVNQTTKTTVQIKDSKNKVVKILATNQSKAAGTITYYWDVSKVNNGTYTVYISLTNSNNQKKTTTQKYTFKKAAPPTIKDIKTSYNTSNNQIKVNFHVNQTTTTTVKIKNSKNKIVKTLVSNKSLKAGAYSYTWSVGNTSDGNYTVSIESVNSNKLKKTATKKFNLYKVKTGTVKASSLNVRQKPTASSKKVGTVPNNKKITLYAKNGSWYQIKYGKVNGYVSTKYVKNVK
ncbi:SpoIID/LytB domain-containing protein [Niallia nealsonii]|uniref:SH3b domain-containing protein n=1 Tax=Niallia nealsonii TaxID=115979 RepID=A0A2N0YWF1_9BACI|nr:SpoIID/LytB domain-containing protein [Niallia nealsonii]PKG21584.1 hypothetical protein CWS01_21625 [Niallia nealsonii]